MNSVDEWKGKVKTWFGELLPPRLEEIAPIKTYSGTETTGWLIQEKIDHFNPGSATARLWIGGGLGQSKITTTFTITDLAQTNATPITLTIKGDSGSYSTLGEQASIGTGPKKDIWRLCRAFEGQLKDLCQ